ncbi:MAG: DNA-directed RNA polymerase [Candidatus Diapherotrites archaeon]|nr:DNA-directed RNA polymerase [Candidatus Diapherotrites archaeon]
MFYLYTVRDSVAVPPSKLSGDLKEAVLSQLKEDLEGRVDEDMGVIVAVTKVKEVGDAVIIPGDPNVFVDTVFEVLTYLPLLQEVVDGYVVDVAEFGLFVRIGPMDGLVHMSQIMDDYVRYDPSIPAFIGRETGRMVGMKDKVRARIVTVSLKETIAESKVGLTMRQPGLGKWEWLQEQEEGENG